MKDAYYNDKKINSLIQNELNTFFDGSENTVYAYAIMNKKNPAQMQIFNNNQEWFDIYLEKKYQFIDPVIIKALRCIEDFHWEYNTILSNGYNLTRIFNESTEHNIYSGHTFPLHDYMNNLVVLSIINLNDSCIDLENNRPRFMSFLIQLHQKTLERYSKLHQKENVFLSPRERQILRWVSGGKTYGEISLILDITERTVKFHMSNVMNKLGVNNARHAVKLGMELRLLDN